MRWPFLGPPGGQQEDTGNLLRITYKMKKRKGKERYKGFVYMIEERAREREIWPNKIRTGSLEWMGEKGWN
jgi:hypothetical protein